MHGFDNNPTGFGDPLPETHEAVMEQVRKNRQVNELQFKHKFSAKPIKGGDYASIQKNISAC
jgi:hypothetical protein